MVAIHKGLGLDPNIPWWCGLSDWTGEWAESCKVPAPSDIRAGQQASMGPAMTPENIEQALARGDRELAAYCYLHPGECGNYQAVVAGQEAETDWLLWAALGAAGLLVLKAVVN